LKTTSAERTALICFLAYQKAVKQNCQKKKKSNRSSTEKTHQEYNHARSHELS